MTVINLCRHFTDRVKVCVVNDLGGYVEVETDAADIKAYPDDMRKLCLAKVTDWSFACDGITCIIHI